jgi:c-di-GMP-binding flagellar brake protein YcgR
MQNVQTDSQLSWEERRKYPRYEITPRMSLAVQDLSLDESIGLGEASDVSMGGLRVRHLPHNKVRLGDRLGLLLMGTEHALSLHGEVVHHGTEDSFGIEFRELSAIEQQQVKNFVERLQ